MADEARSLEWNRQLSAHRARLLRRAENTVERLCAGVPRLAAFELQLPDWPLRRFGAGEPRFRIACRDDAGLRAVVSGDETTIAWAYIKGSLDLEGDMLELYQLRSALTDRHPWLYFLYVHLQPLLFGQVKRDPEWISQHYDYEQDFYLLFLDKATRTYSHALFDSAEESLEEAMERKLEFAFDACRLEPGQRVLDIGGGWGAFVEFAGQRGVRVTSLTISEESERFVQDIIDRQELPCEILNQHFYEHETAEPYDAIVNLGVTEHLPDYARTLAQYARLLKGGGRVYVDASGAREKHNFSSFIYRFIYPGNPSPMCLHDYVTEVARSPFELLALYNDRKSYELTARHWAENLDRARTEIARRWGEELYRKFRLYLWGTVHAFSQDIMSAYRLILELPESGRPGGRWA